MGSMELKSSARRNFCVELVELLRCPAKVSLVEEQQGQYYRYPSR